MHAKDMLMIYSHRLTERVRYTLKLIFTDILGVNIKLTDNMAEFRSCTTPKLNYSNKPAGDELFFSATDILFQTGVRKQDVEVFDWENCKAFHIKSEIPETQFRNSRSSFPFDPFAASFYLASRYEEYLPYKKDEYGRFEAEQSAAYRNGFLQKPIVNVWAEKIRERIERKYPGFSFPEKTCRHISTIDIDHAYAYLGKGALRMAGAYLKALFRFDMKGIAQRTSVLLKNEKDPYDTYQFLFSTRQKYDSPLVFFILFAPYARHDRNLPVNSDRFRSLIRTLALHGEVGIHPSFASHRDERKLQREIKGLSEVLDAPVTKSRQHFLKLKIPDTYRRLIKCGITDDYTMGYASEPGFRAGICTPYYFYDLISEMETGLKVHPFAVMDGTLKGYKKLSNENALSCIKELIREVKAVNGTFISVWHNQSLSNAGEWSDWNDIYESMLKTAAG